MLMDHSTAPLQQILEVHTQALALTLRPGTVAGYRYVTRRFLRYLATEFPQLRHPSELRRDPHILGWYRSLCEQQPPLSNATREDHLLQIRRLLNDLAANGHSIPPDLIRRQDFPPQPRYLPRPLSPQDDALLQHQLRGADDLLSLALLLTRATGIRIGECIDLALNCVRHLGPEQWALHVPLGKLHTERLVPAGVDIRELVDRIHQLRAASPWAQLPQSRGLLLPRNAAREALYSRLARALAEAAERAGCSAPVTPHRLRHTFASEMIRSGLSLPVLMRLLGHKDIRMTLRYVEVTSQDTHREFYAARQRAVQPHSVPVIAMPNCAPSPNPSTIRQAIAATRHLLEMYRRGLHQEKTRRQIQRLDHRLLAVADQLDRIIEAEK
jgi:site-specific recombinase XerD